MKACRSVINRGTCELRPNSACYACAGHRRKIDWSLRQATPRSDLAERGPSPQQFPSPACHQRAAELQPDSATAANNLADTQKARGEYERTVALDPKMSEAYLNLGILLLDNEPGASIAPLNRAVDLLPSQSRPRPSTCSPCRMASG